MIIYGDESGWTGPDLLDEAQPVLAVSTLALTLTEAAELRNRFFGGFEAMEIKFGNLSSSPDGQSAIIEFLQWMVENHNRQRSYIMHKRFALLGKCIDVLVESAVYAAGGDLYAGGGHIHLMRALHEGLPKFVGDRFYTDFLRRWQELGRRPTKKNLDDFFMLISGLAYPARVERLLEPLRTVREVSDDDTLLGYVRRSELDVLASAIWSIAFAWNCAAPSDRLHVIFDEQSKLKTETRAWRVLMDPEFEVGPPMVARLPVVDEFAFGNSLSHPGIQLADILSGSVRFMLGRHASSKESKPDLHEHFRSALSAQVEQLPVQSIWPSDHHRPENSLIDYERAQDLIDATVRSVQSRAQKKR